MNDVISFENSINKIKQLITYFEAKNHKSKKRYKKDKMSTTVLKGFVTFVNIATTSISFTLSLTGIAMIVTPIPIDIACGLTNSNKVV